jgi:hypothetical protein
MMLIDSSYYVVECACGAEGSGVDCDVPNAVAEAWDAWDIRQRHTGIPAKRAKQIYKDLKRLCQCDEYIDSKPVTYNKTVGNMVDAAAIALSDLGEYALAYELKQIGHDDLTKDGKL